MITNNQSSACKYDAVSSEETAVADPASTTLPTSKKRWIKGLLFCALGVAIAFIAHLVLILKLAAKAFSRGYGWSSSSAVIYNCECDTANQTATGLHVLINVIVLTLTATSSYCCQVLSAPSRGRIDVAHSQRVWVSIGSSSFTNIWYAPRWRKMLWILVFGTSLPVQMIYNSFVYVSIGANDFGLLHAPRWLNQGPASFNGSTGASFNVSSDFHDAMGMSLEGLNAEIASGSLQELDGVSCAQAYSQDYQISRSTLVVFSEWFDDQTDLEPWTCQTTQNHGQVNVTGSNSKGKNHPCVLFAQNERRYNGTYVTAGFLPHEAYIFDDGDSDMVYSCYSRVVTVSCELSCSLPIGLAVLTCIGIKLLCIMIAALERRQEIILTVGDAIASFLGRSDPYTMNNCLMTRSNKGHPRSLPTAFRNDYPWVSVFSQAVPFRQGHTPPPQPKRIHSARQRWHCALPERMFRFLLLFKIGIMVLAIMAFVLPNYISGVDVNEGGMSSSEQKINSVYHSKVSLLNGGFLATVLCVNAPQALISIIYSVYNNTLTRLLLASEYNQYAIEQRPLRVSFPTGKQRSTYWLSIPYRYTVPLLTLFTLAHWLSSQAFSLVQIVPINIQGEHDRSRVMVGVSTSSLGMKILAVPVLVALVAIFGLMFRKFQSAAMPIAMNCSAAISAACHPPAGDTEAAEKPVMWGEVEVEVASLSTALGPGVEDFQTECRHCSFTSQGVKEPDPRILHY
ncbi:unnamed protein product [Penicillium salamii]|uniref:DUF6536 domain-containing protein n=1 Tax=Penicillium salamii TaxID=1612424 RepID=A0A9W4NI75_9EURO|nr:unnamed protein product [Penicillium salamii]CAG8110770.1 unnamed protein product [Penicillium salamii]CAG8113360.1 unnamed protein product [Penicillium salamii]CAG8171548.1 unnamed protein product [Penicillium salamii]CAG8222750.1 unnamed protein product [Penicillium salamii]